MESALLNPKLAHGRIDSFFTTDFFVFIFQSKSSSFGVNVAQSLCTPDDELPSQVFVWTSVINSFPYLECYTTYYVPLFCKIHRQDMPNQFLIIFYITFLWRKGFVCYFQIMYIVKSRINVFVVLSAPRIIFLTFVKFFRPSYLVQNVENLFSYN